MSAPRTDGVAAQPAARRTPEPAPAPVTSAPASSDPASTDAVDSAVTTAPTWATRTLPRLELRRPQTEPWHKLLLGSPVLDSEVHASQYAALPAAAGWAMEQFAEEFPDIDRVWAARFLELALNIGWQVPWMVMSHEGGHARVAERHGWDWEIEMTGWMSGLTRYSFPPGTAYTLDQATEASAAGVNQEQLNALYMYRDWASNGGTRYQEALAFLLAQTNLAAYAVNTLRKGSDTPSSDDIASYVEDMQTRGVDLTTGKLAAAALATDLLSASFWAAVIGNVRFVATGDRTIRVPAFALGRTLVTLPNFHLLLDSNGPIIGGTTFVDFPGPMALEVRGDGRLVGQGGGATLQLHGIPLHDRLQLSPYLRITADEERGVGGGAGTALRWEPNNNVGVELSAGYHRNDMLQEVEGFGKPTARDALLVRGGLVARF